MFNIIISCGRKYNTLIEQKRQLRKFDTFQQSNDVSLDVVTNLSPMKLRRSCHKTIYCKGEIYVFGGYDNNCRNIAHVIKNSLFSYTWEDIGCMNDRRCLYCAFTDQIFII